MKRILLPLLCALLGGLLLLLPGAAAEGGRRGVGCCLDLLIPSLFPFLALSGYLVSSGLADRLGTRLERFTRRFFRLPGCSAAVVLMSMIGGYPVGARGAAALRERGSVSREEAERMLCFCVNAGPGFVVGTVGAGLLRSPGLGALLLGSQLLGSVVLSFLSRPLFPRERERKEEKSPPPAGEALAAAVSGAGRGMLNLCAWVVLFAVLLSLLRASGAAQGFCALLLRLGLPAPAAGSLLSVLLEVTGGCGDAAALGASPVFLSFALGWGGLCVHCQALSALPGVRLPRFFLFRLLHGLTAAGITALLLPLFPRAVPAFAGTSLPLRGELSCSPAAAAALLLLCLSLLCVPGGKGMDETRKL